MSAGQKLRFFSPSGQRTHGLDESLRRDVIKGGRDHLRLLDPVAFSFWHKSQIFCGVSGMSICVTPKGASASTTALTMAAVEPMVPASPMPLIPSGFTDVGVSVRVRFKRGRSAARGKA